MGRVCQIEAGADFWYVYADHIQADFMEEVSERLKVRAILEDQRTVRTETGCRSAAN